MTKLCRSTHRIDNWARWDDTVHQAAEAFVEQHGVKPHILLASNVTHNRIDMAANKANIRRENHQAPEPDHHCPLSAFVGPDYELEFCIDDQLADGWFALVFDSDPDGEQEPLPDATSAPEAAPRSALASRDTGT